MNLIINSLYYYFILGIVPFSILLRALYGNTSIGVSESILLESERRGLRLLREHFAGFIHDSAPIALKASFGKYRNERIQLFKSFHPTNLSLHHRLLFSFNFTRIIFDYHMGQIRAAIRFGYDTLFQCYRNFVAIIKSAWCTNQSSTVLLI